MKIKNVKIVCLSMLFSLAFANESDIDNSILKGLSKDNIQIDNLNKEYKNTTIQLIPREEKIKILEDKIEFLKKDIEKWKGKEASLLKIQSEFANQVNANDENIRKWENDVNVIKQQLIDSGDMIEKEKEELSIGQSMIEKDSDIIVINLENGKKIRLIKYLVFPGDSLSKILIRTFEGQQISSSLEHRINTVIKLNKNIKDANTIKVGDTIYIPFFK